MTQMIQICWEFRGWDEGVGLCVECRKDCRASVIWNWEVEAGLMGHHVPEVKVLSAQSGPVLWDPMGCSPPGSSVHGTLQARILEWVAIPFSRGSSLPRDRSNPGLLHCRQILYHLNDQASPDYMPRPRSYEGHSRDHSAEQDR